MEKNNVCTSFGNTNNFGQFGLKKNVDDKTCKYCNKTFKYPCRLLQHMKAKNKCNESFLTNKISTQEFSAYLKGRILVIINYYIALHNRLIDRLCFFDIMTA